MDTPKVKARYGYGSGRIIVDACPYCQRAHYHNPPVDGGQRMADCFGGEYILVFSDTAADVSLRSTDPSRDSGEGEE